jgi:hypothetical protein
MIAAACMEPTEPPPAGGGFKVSKAAFDSVPLSSSQLLLEKISAEASFRFRKQDFGGASSGSRHGIVRFEARVDAEGRATEIRFDPSTEEDLQALARKSIQSVQFRREADATPDAWIPAIVTVPRP